MEFEVPEYTVIENEGSVAVCLRTNIGNDEPINVIVSTSHIATSGELSHQCCGRIIPFVIV